MSRRGLFKIALTGFGACGLGSSPSARAAPPEIKVPDGVTEQKFDFDTKGIEGWTLVRGQWVVEDFAGAPIGKKALVQRATRNEFNVIVAPAGPFTDVDISVKFDPLSGKEDASGGIVFRFTDGKYYVVRANALEGNFRLYYYDGGRRQDGALLLDHRDSRFKSGRVGLWTKADSITAFNDFTIRGVTGGA